MNMTKVSMFDIEIDNLTIGEAIQKIIDDWAVPRKRSMITTPNVDVIVQLYSNKQLRDDFGRAEIVLADGAPIVLASRLLGTPLKERVAGADILPRLCERARDRNLRVMLLGGGEGVAQAAAQNLRIRYPGLDIHAHTPSFGFDTKPDECISIVTRINELKPHLLFVGIGTPRQERWIVSHQDSYYPCVSMGVGGSFDFEAGRIKRAPELFRKTGFEWLFRLAMEPRRLYRRYLIDDRRFLGIVADELFAKLMDRRSRNHE